MLRISLNYIQQKSGFDKSNGLNNNTNTTVIQHILNTFMEENVYTQNNRDSKINVFFCLFLVQKMKSASKISKNKLPY